MDIIQDLLDQVQIHVSSLQEHDRAEVSDRLRSLAISFENYQQTWSHLLFSPFQLMVIRIAVDLNLLSIITEAKNPLSVSELSQRTGAGSQVLGRLLRFMSSYRMIREEGKDSFSANNVTKVLADPGIQSGARFHWDYQGPCQQIFPEFLKQRGYQDAAVLDVFDCVVPVVYQGGKTTFEDMVSKPEVLADFQMYLKARRHGLPTWLNVYPLEELTRDLEVHQGLFVDVGGGVGHQAIALRNALPDLPNRIVLQDLPQTVEQSIKHTGVDAMAQDFFEPQVIKGARVYYLRNVIHDWPGEKAVQILTHLKNALVANSVILIDEMYLPTENVHWEATNLGLAMMMALAAMERTGENWGIILKKAGLKIRKVYKYTPRLNECIIECVPIERVVV